MNILELKGSIVEKIGQIQDKSFLAFLNAILKDFIESAGEENWFKTGNYNLTPEQEAKYFRYFQHSAKSK